MHGCAKREGGKKSSSVNLKAQTKKIDCFLNLSFPHPSFKLNIVANKSVLIEEACRIGFCFATKTPPRSYEVESAKIKGCFKKKINDGFKTAAILRNISWTGFVEYKRNHLKMNKQYK